MANTVFKLRRSSVAGKVPNTSTLSIGELGLNLTDRKLYSSDGTNVWETGANLTTLTVSTNTNVNNVIFPLTGGIYANGTFGLDTQVLKSNGSAIYWGTGGGGTGMTTVKQQYTGDGVTNTFSVTGGYDSNNLAVYVNGVMLRKGVEVDVISGTTFTIYNPPPNNAYIDVLGTATTIANGFSVVVSQQFTSNGNSNSFVIPSGFLPTTVQVYLNGVKQIPAVDYTTSGGNTVNFFTTPPNNYIVDVFAYNTTVMQSAPVRQSNTADGTSTSYVISGGYIPAQLDVYMNGVKLNPSQANVASGYNVTFSSAPPAGAELSFVGFVPTNYVGVNTSASYVWSNTQTFGNVFITGTAGINANNSYGTSGQVLTSNGTSVYWSNSATFVRQTFTGTGACTTFQVTGGYTPNNLDVYVTGVKQLSGTDVTISSGSNVVFTVAPPNNAPIEVVGVVPLNYTYANQSYSYVWTGNHTFGNATVNATVNSSLISIGNTTVNTQIVAGNVYLNGSTLLIGNSSSNVIITGTSIKVSNSTTNVIFTTGPLSINTSIANYSSSLNTIDTATFSVLNSNVSGLGTSSKINLNIAGIGSSVISGYYDTFNGSNDIGTGLVIGTQSNAASGSVERMRINSNGNIGIGGTPTNYAGWKSLALNSNTNGTTIDHLSSNTRVSTWYSNSQSTYIGTLTATPLNLVSNNTTVMTFDAAGRVTMPYQPIFYAYGASTQSMTGTQAARIVQLPFQLTFGSRPSYYDTVNYKFTVPIAGTYMFMMKYCVTATATGPESALYVNGASQQYGAIQYSGAGYSTATSFHIWQCAASDYIEFRIVNNNTTTFTVDTSRSAFAGWLMG